MQDARGRSRLFIVLKERKPIALDPFAQVRDQLRELDLVIRFVQEAIGQGVDPLGPNHDGLDRRGFEFVRAGHLGGHIADALGGGGEIFLLEIMRQHGAHPCSHQWQDGREDIFGCLRRIR